MVLGMFANGQVYGALDKIPANFCKKYKYKIINIHPALLPRFGWEIFKKFLHETIIETLM